MGTRNLIINMKVTLAIFAALVAVAIAAPIVNHDIIAAVNNDESSTWTAGVNKAFEGMSVEQMKALLNVQVTKEQPIGLVGPDAAKTMQEEADRVAASLPSSFEAAKAHPECGTLLSPNGIENQERCGSCWAFSATEVLADELCFLSKGKVQMELSAQDLVSCDRTNMGCNGGMLGAAWTYMERSGVATWECLPYTSGNGTTGQCPSQCADGSPIKRYHATGAKHITSLFGRADKIAEQLMTYGVAQAAFTVYADFMQYKSGVYVHKTGNELGGHAVKIVGFGELNGVPYWKVANSWGDSWGMDGFFLIKRGDNECGFEADVWMGHAASTTPSL